MGIGKFIFNRVVAKKTGGKFSPGMLQSVLRLPIILPLCLRLMRDERVPLPLRASVIGIIAFILSPIDLPFDIPIIGQYFGAGMVVVVLEWFIKLAPAHVVNEHIDALGIEKRVPKRSV